MVRFITAGIVCAGALYLFDAYFFHGVYFAALYDVLARSMRHLR